MPCRDTNASAVRKMEERNIIVDSITSGDAVKTEDGLSSMEIKALLQQLNIPRMGFCKSDDDPFQNDYMTRLIAMLPPSLPDNRMPKDALDYMVSILVYLLNQHWWCHTNSCFKQSRTATDSTFCRYLFPRDRVDHTTFSQSGVELKRGMGHDFINGYSYVLMATFKCNHDIQVLLGGRDATQRIHYSCKYVTKNQKQVDSTVAVALAAFKRRQEKEKLEEEVSPSTEAQDRLAIARKRVASVVYAMTNRQAIAGPLAALYLQRGSCCYSSSNCVNLPLGDVVRQLCRSDEYSCNLVQEKEDTRFHVVSFLDDYIYRPSVLGNTNLYEFTMHFFRKETTQCALSAMHFFPGHPLSHSHSIGQRYTEVVPVVQGYRLPFIDERSPREFQYKRAVLSLVLFKPFRDLSDLIGSGVDSDADEAWLNEYDVWQHTRSDFIKTIMSNMDDYYYALSHSNSEPNTSDNPAAVEEIVDRECARGRDNDALFSAEGDIYEDGCDFETGTDSTFIDIWNHSTSPAAVPESECVSPAICPTTAAPESRLGYIMQEFCRFGLLEGVALKTSAAATCDHCTLGSLSVADMRKWKADTATDNALDSTSNVVAELQDTKVIELLGNALRESNLDWHPCDMNRCECPQAVNHFASIGEISKAFTLNERQHFAVRTIGTALLTRWRKIETSDYLGDNMQASLRDDQLRLFLGREGGTGKSRIIEAIEALCASWGRSDNLVKTALTGKAATIIGGRTLASFLLQLGRDTSIDAVMNLSIVVIDEVSMMKKDQLVQLDKVFRVAKRVPDVLFGGIHVILVGDFLQLPPVGGDPIYRDPTSKKKKLRVVELIGYQLWRSFEDVIVLEESVRFQSDPEWGQGCHQARLGLWTAAFVQIINSRVVTQANTPVNSTIGMEAPVFVTPDNATRISINHKFISATAKCLPTGEYPVRIVANFKGKLAGLSRVEQEMVMALPDTKFGRMAPYLDLIVGMPVQVTQNIRPEKMVANGTLGTLEEIIYQPNTTFRLVHDTNAKITVKLPSAPPQQ